MNNYELEVIQGMKKVVTVEASTPEEAEERALDSDNWVAEDDIELDTIILSKAVEQLQ